MSRGVALALAVLLTAPALLSGLGSLPLVDPDEGRYAWAARQMAREGLELTPYFNDSPRFAKPAPLNWLQALAMRALGETELALRLPGALLALGAVLLCFGAAHQLGGPWAGLIAASVLGLGFRFVAIGRQALVDGPLQLALMGALWALLRCLGSSGPARARAFLEAHLWMAMGMLLKGPIAVLLPWLAILGYALWSRSFELLRGARAVRALAALLAAALPYYFGMLWIHGGYYLEQVLYREHVERFLGVNFGQPSARGFDYFLRVAPADLLPFTPAVVLGLVLLWQQRSERGSELRKPIRFLVAWTVVVFVVFALPKFKLPHYVLPAYPALAILTGYGLSRPSVRGHGFWAAVPGAAAIAAVAALGAMYLAVLGESGRGLWALAAVVAMVLPVLARGRPSARHGLAALAVITLAAYLVLALDVAPRLGDRFRPERVLARQLGPDAPVSLYAHWSSAFVYYAGRRVEVLANVEELRRFAAGPRPAYVLTPLPLLPELVDLGVETLASGPMLAPRLRDLWSPRQPKELALVVLRP